MKNTIKTDGKIMGLNEPIVMGILNTTPDSFYKDSRINPNGEEFLKKAAQMVHEGVDVFDIGGYSTRPGAAEVSLQEEIDRIVPAVKKLRETFPQIPVSIDTFRAAVAEQALYYGASIINDISGGDFDPEMFPLVIEKKIPYILMHLQGDLNSMHSETTYTDFLPETLNELFRKANYLRSKGVPDVVLDPGFGFSKTTEQNYFLLRNLELLQSQHFPILAGMSRKSMIYKPLGITAEDTLPFSVHLHSLAMASGAKIVRVHDVAVYKDAVKIHRLTYPQNRLPLNNILYRN